MITFKPIHPEDRKIITSFTLSGEYRDNNLSICNLCSWQAVSHSCFAIVNEQLVIRFHYQNESFVYTLPFGHGDTAQTLELIYQEALRQDRALFIFGSNPFLQKELETYFPRPFEYNCMRDHYDYLYYRAALAELKGKNYQPKRNHANRFRKKYDYQYQVLTPAVLPHCLELAEKWCEQHNCEEDKNLQYEQQAMRFAIEHYEALGLTGGALWVDNEIVAFTYGAPVNYDTFCIHIEKANTQFDGAYTVINQEFASRIPEHFTYLNREEDLGIPGLRKAKLSYYPALLLEKCRAVLIGQ